MNCKINAYVTSMERNVGGICGLITLGAKEQYNVSMCHVHGNDVQIGGHIGLIIDSGSLSEYSNSFSFVTGAESIVNVGGFVGIADQDALVRYCQAHGNILAGERIGGFCGFIYQGAQIINCNARGSVNQTPGSNGARAVGGFCGWIRSNTSVIENCYSVGKVNGTTAIGGLVGLVTNSPLITNSYYDSEKSGQFDTGKGEPRTTKQLQKGKADTFINPDGTIDLTENSDNAMYTGWNDQLWRFNPNEKYPRLKLTPA
jgi:hypothetical protein